MIGMCAGMALNAAASPSPIRSRPSRSIGPFEMVRDDLCYQNLPVTVVGMGGGVTYSTLGATHHAQEDVAIAGAIPNMNVIAPCDPAEAEAATRWCATQERGRSICGSARPASPILTRRSRRAVGVRQDPAAAAGRRRLHPLLRPDHEDGVCGRASGSRRPANRRDFQRAHPQAARPRRSVAGASRFSATLS